MKIKNSGIFQYNNLDKRVTRSKSLKRTVNDEQIKSYSRNLSRKDQGPPFFNYENNPNILKIIEFFSTMEILQIGEILILILKEK